MVDESNIPPFPNLEYGDIRLKLGHQIARGGFSTVFKANDDYDNDIVVKVFNKDSNPLMWTNEVVNYQCLYHPMIVHMYGAFELDGQGYIILENGGISIGRVNLTDPKERNIIFLLAAKGVLEALHFMHRKGFVHTDMNPANILLKLTPDNKPISIKVCDLGLTLKETALTPGKHKAKWNPPPETIDPIKFGRETYSMDIYSASLVLMQILYGEDYGYFSDDEIVSGAPQKMALSMGSLVGDALAAGLEPIAAERPNPLQFWRSIRKAGYAQLKQGR